MTDFGTVEERAVALRVALAAKEFNLRASEAYCLGLTVDVEVSKSDSPTLQIGIERRTMILPTTLETRDVA
jgi:hypothetical protein